MTKIKYLHEFADDGTYLYFLTDGKVTGARSFTRMSHQVSLYEDMIPEVMDALLAGYTIVPVVHELVSAKEINMTEYTMIEKQEDTPAPPLGSTETMRPVIF